MKNLICKALVSGLLLIPGVLRAQYDQNFEPEYFFSRLPNARSEALGRADVALGGTAQSVFTNPAAIGQIEELHVALNTAAPLYLLSNADYYFGGIAYRVAPKLVAGLQYNQLAIGESDFEIFINGDYYPIDRPRSNNLCFTLAAEPVKNLRIGINNNLYIWKYLNQEPRALAWHLDAGAMYTLELGAEREVPDALTFGASLTNSLFGGIQFGVDTFRTRQELPTVGRLGVSYKIRRQLSIPGMEPGPIDLTLVAEYQNLLNSEYLTAYRAGAELVLLDVLALRTGAYTEAVSDEGFPAENRSRINDITFGGGLHCPLDQLSSGKYPVDLWLDITVMKQPPFTFSGSRLPNFRSFGLRMYWNLP
ncbi:MAG: hypothetical protein SF053_01475 [Bacteroidia bacterium]|nr:hypothetical protein [Bacteroidia bacterium]